MSKRTHDDYIRALVAAAPPFSAAQEDRIRRATAPALARIRAGAVKAVPAPVVQAPAVHPEVARLTSELPDAPLRGRSCLKSNCAGEHLYCGSPQNGACPTGIRVVSPGDRLDVRPSADVARSRVMCGVYFVRSGEVGPIKIGMSRNVSSRVAELQSNSGERLTLLAVIETAEPGATERDLHRRFSDLRLHGEWFRPEAHLMRFIEQVAAIDATDRGAA